MASIPQFYSNHTFPSDCVFPDFSATTPEIGISSSLMQDNTMWGGHPYNLLPMLDNNFGSSDHIASMDCDTMSSTWLPAYSDHPVGVSELTVPEGSDLKTWFYGSNNEGFQTLSGGIYQQRPHMGDFGEECCGIVEDVKPLACPKTATENWGIHGNQMLAVDQENIKVGRYSEEERKERILRYVRKRNQRNYNKTIKYACRKTLADRRVRVRGRFARNNELCEDEIRMKKNIENLQHDDLYGGDSIHFQLKNDEEDWLQEAMESLVFLSHSSPDDI